MATNVLQFTAVYIQELRKAHDSHPEEYAWPIEEVPAIAERMVKALANGSANKDSQAIRSTCRILNVKHTYQAIRAFLTEENPS